MEIKGFTYGFNARRGDLLSPEAVDSRARLMALGINWVCFAFTVRQKTFASTEIMFDYARTPTDKEITQTIAHFHENGVKVCLKPILNCDDGMWRALIDFPDSDMMGQDKYWDAWFASYGAFMLHYAEIAADTGCAMYCTGCEMSGTERKEGHWRELLAKVRHIYPGLVTYNTNHGNEEKIAWWDAVDYIGTSAYYPVARKGGASTETMVAAWEKVGRRMEAIAAKYDKPLLFAEIGCRSAKGCAAMPWDFTHMHYPRSEEEQARFYDSCLRVFAGQGWFAGAFWWDWSTKIYRDKETAAKDLGFNIHMKKAEEVVRAWYKN
ncbi:MAG: glycosyl hydrolase family 53 [Lachnospiraceae bacterium]|jgi:hypothetical protein|nr:glycosyl hydrolase family 53 [Lachnospiraceae bacterium]